MRLPTDGPEHHPGSRPNPALSAGLIADAHRVALAAEAGRPADQLVVEDQHLLAVAGAQAEVRGQSLARALRDIAVGAIRECLDRSADPAEDASWLMSVATVQCRIRQGAL